MICILKNQSEFGEEVGVEQVWRQREARKEGGAVIREDMLGFGPMRWGGFAEKSLELGEESGVTPRFGI